MNVSGLMRSIEPTQCEQIPIDTDTCLSLPLDASKCE